MRLLIKNAKYPRTDVTAGVELVERAFAKSFSMSLKGKRGTTLCIMRSLSQWLCIVVKGLFANGWGVGDLSGGIGIHQK